MIPGEIKSWWLGGLRSGPPSCVNQAIQTVIIMMTILMQMTMMMLMMISRVQWETGLVEVWVGERKVDPQGRSL